MDAQTTTHTNAGLSPEIAAALANDSNAVALIKAYFAIPDETVKKKLRRLAEEIAGPARRNVGLNGSGV